MVLYERKFVSLHHKTDKRKKITFKRLFCYNYKEALKMKLLIYFFCLLCHWLLKAKQTRRLYWIVLTR